MRNVPTPNVATTLAMGVADMTFLVDKLGEDCSPLQFVRELTQNALESVRATPNKKGDVTWDVAWQHLELTKIYKISIVDSGLGMTGTEMVEYINKLSSSIHKQSRQGNFGVGAKIAALPKNPEGLLYFSWKDGLGYTVHLWKDPDSGEYGLKRWDRPDGSVEHWAYIDDLMKPQGIESHGTQVILLGLQPEHNTMVAPPEARMPSRWILRYLNTRYFQFPKTIKVRAREGWDKPKGDRHNFLREVTGEKLWLDANSSSKGSVDLSSARAHWWILKEDVDDDSGHYASGGHVAALYQDELYELVDGRAGVARLQGFGIIFGCNRVVLYVEPDVSEEFPVSANIARTTLLRAGEALPWTDWMAQFRDKIPQPIVDLMDEISANSGVTDHRATIKERLKQFRDLYRFSRYRPASGGKHRIDDSDTSQGGSAGSSGESKPRPGGGSRGGRGGSSGDVYSLFLSTNGTPAEEVISPVEPECTWTTVEAGTRTPGDLEDRAARYLPEQNRLLINGDFRVVVDMVERWNRRYIHAHGARPVVEAAVREWFEQQLVETIMGSLALRQSGQWTLEDLKRLWSEEALTAAVLPRYHIDNSVKRALGSKLGTLKEVVAAPDRAAG